MGRHHPREVCDVGHHPGRWRRPPFDRFLLAHYLRARLHRRLLAYFGATILVTGALVSVVVLFGQGGFGTEWRDELGRIERFVGSRFARVWQDPEARLELAESTARELSVGVRLLDETGGVLARFGPDCVGHELEVPIEDRGVRLGAAAFCLDRRNAHGGLMHVFVPLFVALVVLWAATGKLARRLARPLADVARVAQEIGQGKLESRARLDRSTPGEVGVLAESINDMAVRIERQVNDQRVLLAAVSHELRTPLGHARILLEILRSKGADAKSLDEVERELVEIDTLVGELLASSRLDFSILTLRDIDAFDLAARALERAGLPPDRLEREIGQPGTSATLTADPTLLGRALANLLDNAAKHGAGATALRVTLEAERVKFEVDDAGPGIPSERAADVFTPFYRGREGGGEHGTLGLGLSLVKRIAEAHRGTAHAGSRPGGGARVGFGVPRRPKE